MPTVAAHLLGGQEVRRPPRDRRNGPTDDSSISSRSGQSKAQTGHVGHLGPIGTQTRVKGITAGRDLNDSV